MGLFVVKVVGQPAEEGGKTEGVEEVGKGWRAEKWRMSKTYRSRARSSLPRSSRMAGSRAGLLLL